MIRFSSNPARLNLIRRKRKKISCCAADSINANHQKRSVCGTLWRCAFISTLSVLGIVMSEALTHTVSHHTRLYLIAPQRTVSIDVLQRYCVLVSTRQTATLSRVTQVFGKAEFQKMKEQLMLSKNEKETKNFLITSLCS